MRNRIICFVTAAVLCASGCGGGAGKVKGQLVENGQPIAVEGQAAIMFYLMGSDGKPDPGKSYPMPLLPDGSFDLVASGGTLPPGTYLVALEINGPKSDKGIGRYKGKYSFPDSPLRQEVKGGQNTVTIELAKPPG